VSVQRLRGGLRPAAQGFAVQSYVTGEGPYANWAKHVADPFGYNLLTILSGEDRVPTL
jgi:light-harvesting complex II chlorophyll a/b binding protein 5